MPQSRLLRFGILLGAIAIDAFVLRPGADVRRVAGELAYPRSGIASAMAAQGRLNQDILDLPGVAGTAVAFDAAGRPVVKVYLVEAAALELPAALDGHAVVSEVTGAFRALGAGLEDAADPEGAANANDDADAEDAADANDDADAGDAAGRDDDADLTNPRLSFPRPVPIGVSTGQPDVTAGTIGARIVVGGAVYALSNNHVFANRNQARVGDNILQPGRADGGADPSDAIGTLHDFEPIRFCQPFPMCPENRIDAAIAATTVADLDHRTPSNGYGSPRSRTVKARLGMAVQKYGRTTGHTHGQISGVNATMNIGFRDRSARFSGQIVITGGGFSGPGDSGSLIVAEGGGSNDRRPVALLFAGSQTSTLANPIDLVLDRFGAEIDGR